MFFRSSSACFTVSLKKLQTAISLRRLSASKAGSHTRKVSIIGAGSVGSACASTLLNRGVAREICLICDKSDRVKGELRDLREGSAWLNNARVIGGNDYALTSCSEVVIIAAGCRRKPDQSRYEVLKENIDIVGSVVKKLMEYNENPILIVISNPVDIMTQIAWEKSGLPLNRVFGTGTTIDTIRFQYYLSKRLDVAPSECQGWILGGHGEECVPIWSNLNVAGLRLREVFPDMGTKFDRDNWNELHKKVISAGSEIIKAKGYTNWCISLCAAILTDDILNNTNKIRSVSTAAIGHYQIDKNVFLSLPCVITSNGIKDIVKLSLDSLEMEKMKEAANKLHDQVCPTNIPNR